MIYYFLPDVGVFGGVKVACQFVEQLHRRGIPAVVVFACRKVPEWFRFQAPVIGEVDAIERLTEDDIKMITWPPDHLRLRDLPGRMVCHSQGTDPLMDPIFADPRVEILTCWDQARDYVREKFTREPIEVGISIPDIFFFDGARKADNLVAFMPRRGFPWVRACFRACRDLDFVPIDGLGELEVAALLKSAGIFLATSVGEQFGLPALEAMAAGCAVLSVPVKGGFEYLHTGENCYVEEPEELCSRLRWLTRPENSAIRARLRSRGIATAGAYRPSQQAMLLDKLQEDERWTTLIATAR